MAKNHYYVVWCGWKPGVYDSWPKCLEQVNKFKGAKYKGFPNRQAAESAFKKPHESYIKVPKNQRHYQGWQ